METTAKTPPRNAFVWIDAVRFLAAMLVVMEHSRDLLFLTLQESGGLGPIWQLYYFLTGLGSEAVVVFFVISGFWITGAVERALGKDRFWPNYLIDRLSRLMIVVVPALLLGLVFDSLSVHVLASGYAAGTSGAFSVEGQTGTRLGLNVLLGNLAFLQRIVVPTYGSNGPLWSLANEFWYYIWFPALLIAWRFRRLSPALLALGIAVLSPGLIKGFGVWLMGSAVYYLDRRTGRVRPMPAWGRAALLLTLGVFALALAASRLSLPYLGDSLVLGLAFALLLWTLLRLDPAQLPLLPAVAHYGSSASFSLYAAHFPFLMLLAGCIPPGARSAPDFGRLLTWCALVVAIAVWGWLFARATEAHTWRLRAALRARI